MGPGDIVVTGYGVLNRGFNRGPNVASAVNTACRAWYSDAMEHAEHLRNMLTIQMPFEKLLVLAAQKLAAGKWCCGNAQTYEALEPEQFQQDINVMVSYLEMYLDDTQAFWKMGPETDWACRKATIVDMMRASTGVMKIIVHNYMQPKGTPFVLPNEEMGSVTDSLVDGTSCPHCCAVGWLSVIVCPTCNDQEGQEAGPTAPLCCLRCAPSMFGSEHDRHLQGSPAQKRLMGCHAPVVVQRLSNRSV